MVRLIPIPLEGGPQVGKQSFQESHIMLGKHPRQDPSAAFTEQCCQDVLDQRLRELCCILSNRNASQMYQTI